MNFKIVVKYLTIYISLAVIAVLIAIRFWWTDSLTLSSHNNKETMALLGAAGIMWFAVIFLSILLIQALYLKDIKVFISPLNFNTEELAVRVGTERSSKAKRWLTFISFSVFLLSVFLFKYCMNLYGDNQLKNNGIIQMVTVKDIRYNLKKNSYAHLEYYHKGISYNTNLPSDTLRKGDTIEIIFSKENPNIVDFKATLSKE